HRLVRVADTREVDVAHRVGRVEAHEGVAVSQDEAPWHVSSASNPTIRDDLDRPPIRIITSRKRRRTVAARLRSGVLELLVPATMPHSERVHWAEVMTRRLQRRAERTRPSDERLADRAHRLNDRHFDGRLRWTSIGFADMERLWGSCTFTDGAIR